MDYNSSIEYMSSLSVCERFAVAIYLFTSCEKLWKESNDMIFYFFFIYVQVGPMSCCWTHW